LPEKRPGNGGALLAGITRQQPVDCQMADDAATDVSEILVEGCGACALIALNRPRALNAVNSSMRQTIADTLRHLTRDTDLYAVVMKSTVDGVFSVGGDIRELAHWARTDPERACQSLAAEYALNWLQECFSKPTVALIDGPVMGTGVGLTMYATHRVAGERYAFAMPETAIGFFPDDGLAYTLARLPGEMGMYLGLTGRSIGRADALRLGLATHSIRAQRFAEIERALADADPVDPVLDSRQEHPGAGTRPEILEVIARCFAAESVELILERLAAERGEQAWCEDVIADLNKRSPLALAVTFRHIRRARALDLRLTLEVDHRLACRLIRHPDFAEGVRALIIDKDKKPSWRPSRLSDVSDVMLEGLFAPMTGQLALPTRQEMQASRV
jgi:enoyl-CoA hydratase